MENRSHAFLASAFIVMLTVALVIAALWIEGRGRPHLVFDLVTGQPLNKLDERAPVQFQGVTVGRVHSIRFDHAHPGTTVVRVSIDASTPITKGTYAELLYQGASAIPYVLLVDPDPTAPPLLTDPRHPTRIAIVPTGLDETGEVARIAMAHLGKMAQQLKELSAPGNRSNMASVLANLQVVASGMHDFQAKLAPALRGMAATSSQARAIMQQARVLSVDVQQLSASLRQRAATLRTLSASTEEFKRAGTQARQELNRDTVPRLQALGSRVSHLGGAGSGSVLAFPGGHADRHPDPGEPGFQPRR